MTAPMRTAVLFAALQLAATGAQAHGGEDHSHQAPAAAPQSAAPAVGGDERPQRLSDGSLFVPKPLQRRLGLRTLPAASAEHPQVVELNGRVIADPAAGGRVQAPQAGRVLPGPAGLALLGRRVRQGEVLAMLQPVSELRDLGDRQAQLAEIDAQAAVAERRLARLEQLDGVVPARDTEAARFELEGLRARKAALGAGLDGRIPLTAPVAGVVAAVSVVNGQIVDARETLFEIVDPQRLAVEALAYDAALVDAVGGASLALDGAAVELDYLGGGRVLREQALPLIFRVRQGNGAGNALAVGQPVKVLLRSSARHQGVALPAAAVTRNPAGENVVWVHAAAERFVPRKVDSARLDGATLVVTAGLAAGERVVVEGAPALARVR